MTTLAVIPARGGSKGVPAKNLAPVAACRWSRAPCARASAARLVTDVVVSTDDADIAAAARAAGAEVVLRPAAIAGDTATSEAAVLHAMDAHEAMHGAPVDVVLLVQCTSPFLTREDIEGSRPRSSRAARTRAVTVAPFHGFVWREDESDAGQAVIGAQRVGGSTAVLVDTAAARGYGVNHDASFRPRRQDRPQDFLETGAAYAMSATGFREAGHRFFGRTALVRTDPARVLESTTRTTWPGPARSRRSSTLPRCPRATPSTPSSWTSTAPRPTTASTSTRTAARRSPCTAATASASRRCARPGLELLILSTEQNPVVAARGRKLEIPVLHGIDRKDLALKQWCDERGIAPERVLYVGNDVNDLRASHLVGWPVAVARPTTPYVPRRAPSPPPRGGEGAIREIASWLLGPDAHTPLSSPRNSRPTSHNSPEK